MPTRNVPSSCPSPAKQRGRWWCAKVCLLATLCFWEITRTAAADLTLSAIGPVAPVAVGSKFNLTVSLRNSSFQTTSNAVVRLDLPPGFRVLGLSPNSLGATITNHQPPVTELFGASFRLTTGAPSGPEDSAIADLDGDERLDLITANTLTNTLSIFRSVGNARGLSELTFAERFDLVGGGGTAVATADLDGDGKRELILSDSVRRNLSSPGQLAFGPPIPLAGALGGSGVGTPDLNRDGRPDIVVISGGGLVVFENLTQRGGGGDLSFGPAVFLPGGVALSGLTKSTWDLDGDERLDLVAVDSQDSSIWIWRNQWAVGTPLSASGFSAPIQLLVGEGLPGARNVQVGDLNGDGRPELVVCSSVVAPFLAVWPNLSTPGGLSRESFGEPQFIEAGYPQDVVIADLDGDERGPIDLIVLDRALGQLKLWKNISDDRAIQFTNVAVLSAVTGTHLKSEDLDQDGQPDLIVDGTTGDGLVIFPNTAIHRVLVPVTDLAAGSEQTMSFVLIADRRFAGDISLAVSENEEQGASKVRIGIEARLVPAVAITSQPESQFVWGGSNATFQVGIRSTTPATYQWRLNGADLPNATNATLTISNTSTNDEGFYTVVVAEGNTSVTSGEAALVLVGPISAPQRLVDDFIYPPESPDGHGGAEGSIPALQDAGLAPSCLEPFVPGPSDGIKTVCLNFHLFQKADGTGNYSDTPADLARLDQAVKLVNDIFSMSVSRDVVKGPTDLCPGTMVMEDTKIRFRLANVWFYRNDDLWNSADHAQLQDAAFLEHPNAPLALNVYWTGGYYLGASGYATLPSVDPGYHQFIVMLNRRDNSGNPSLTLAHELGHALDLHHTYNSDTCSPASCEFLSDLYCPPTNPCPQDADWACDPRGANSCTDNIMGGTGSSSFFTRLQIGKMHRALLIKSAAKYRNCPACTPAPDDMVLWLPLDETVRGTAQNIMAPAFPGTHQGHPITLIQSGGRGLSFRAMEKMSVPHYAGLQSGFGDLTIDAWVKRGDSDMTMTRYIVDKLNVSGAIPQGYALSIEDGELVFEMGDGSLYGSMRSGLWVPGDGQWHHVAVTVERQNPLGGTFYLDGLPGGNRFNPNAKPGVTLGSFFNGTPLIIGSGYIGIYRPLPTARVPVPDGYRNQAFLDEIEIFSRALRPSEILAIARADAMGKCKNLRPTIVCPEPLRVDLCDPNVNTASVHLTAEVSDPEGDALTVIWDFGAGRPRQSSTLPASAAGVRQTATLTASFPRGQHLVTVRVRDGTGNQSTCVLAVRVDEPPPVGRWVSRGGGTLSDSGNAIAVDRVGNVYVTGRFLISATFGSVTLTADGADMYVAKYNSVGDVQWVVQAGSDGNAGGTGVAVGPGDTIYVTGFLDRNCSFGGQPISAVGSSDLFVAKYDASGNLLWVRRAGGTQGDYAAAIAVDPAGDCYITGYFAGTATFGTAIVTATGVTDVFTAKYSSAGVAQWVRQAGGTGAGTSAGGRGIGVDAVGNSFTVGGFLNNMMVPGSTTLSRAGHASAFVIKYDPAGTVQWSRQTDGSGEHDATAVAVDAAGNAWMTGYFNGTCAFPLSAKTVTSRTSLYDYFVVKYAPNATVLWATQGDGNGDDESRGIAVDNKGNCYVTGFLSGSGNFVDAGPDIFAAKHDPAGRRLFLQSIHSAPFDYNVGQGIAVDSRGCAYLTGRFDSDNVNFPPLTFPPPATPLRSRGTDMFVGKLCSPCESCRPVEPKTLGLFNTGVDITDVILTPGVNDPHYQAVSSPVGAVGPVALMPYPGWIGWPGESPAPVSRWINIGTDASGLGGQYVYHLALDLSTLSEDERSCLVLRGRWAADNGAELYVNGQLKASLPGSVAFRSWTPLIVGGVPATGPVVLEFRVHDQGVAAGLRVEWTKADPCGCVECVPPIITQHPSDHILAPNVTSPVTLDLRTTVTGSQPLSYQWYSNGRPLVDGPNVSGANGPALSMTLLLALGQMYEAEVYCVVSNPCGLVSSRPARVSNFSIAAPSWTGGVQSGQVNLTFPTASKITYVVESTTDLSAPSWQALRTIQGTGSALTVTVPTPMDGAAGFYRLRIDEVPIEEE